jgi:hypothetical protein
MICDFVNDFAGGSMDRLCIKDFGSSTFVMGKRIERGRKMG